MQIAVAYSMDSLQDSLIAYARAGQGIALVPTMGALHDGHLALIEEARRYADAVAVSIFVNPAQFGVNEDFDAYPRMLEEDVEKAAKAGASLVYAPTIEDIYPEGFATRISVGKMGNLLCGRFRPGHFDGVATVVAKLLLRFLPRVALFGEKDFQQLAIIRQVVGDLDIPVDIVGVPTKRESDGLAMSSRNLYLTPQQRDVAPVLYATLKATAARIVTGTPSAEAIGESVEQLTASGYKVDYLELCDGETLESVAEVATGTRLLVAAWLGKTRLIDNIAVG